MTALKPPKTWDELMAVNQALKAKNITPFANGTATAWQNETIVGGPALVHARQAVRRRTSSSGKANFTDPRYVNALAKLKDVSQYFAPNFIGVDYAVLAAALRWPVARRCSPAAPMRSPTSRTKTRPSISACSRLPGPEGR